jgi:ABC-type proline/glycine betaine transport system permease subunit
MRCDFSVKGVNIVKNMCQLMAVPRVAVFLIVVTYMGMTMGTIQGFLFWYLTDLGASPLLFALCLVANCASEVSMKHETFILLGIS